ncbi:MULTISPECIES: glycogen/starch/alpha-glucan phosphorylase [unclassified Lactococcus]|uniref:glycogen/starch/alpha-glucan phosphorylase n=1 Tax=unclassified Lactococcus TaxID=2643510 RepID=UPI0011CA593F|nr:MULTISPECIES: glycogen/starch/alpha-glucan phosphorylase [unclassified Lactococcus]MQW22447.1 glycogen/starch/alpha-glucan family phosphorylase [Lactococcus sp. dk101]TXK45476.1 glycogen/starch/alpha-glucan phosphorylase [Lactococcus sp. dk310]TXK51809.1 glycogen/starch/alpha-glucan phosphorylase [Lactococcus sp. dk322]
MKLTKKQFKQDFEKRLTTKFATDVEKAGPIETFAAVASVVKAYYSTIWQDDNEYKDESKKKQAYYFSIEFLPGKMLKSNLLNLGIMDTVREGLSDLGIDLDTIAEMEPDMAIGNGGLGRLGSCFLDSAASTGIPLNGNGIRYSYGLFKQKIVDGYQVELPDSWLDNGNPWEVRRSDKAFEVRFGGEVWLEEDGKGNLTPRYRNQERVLAVPYDTPMVGFENTTVNNMCLWRSEVPKDLDLRFQNLDYMRQTAMLSAELYPDDSNYDGRLLRLKQEYFFVSAGLQRLIKHFENVNKVPITHIADFISVHINDTHPALCVPEFMRILVDEYGIGWERAWNITVKVMSYTNHTILSEALEKWPEDMVKTLLPRIYQIILEIDRRRTAELLPKVGAKLVHSTRIVKDGQIHMANLSIIGSHSTNGVAKLHSDLLKDVELHDFYLIYPERFNNKTNGIADRRWSQISNERLSTVLDETIGKTWRHNLNELKLLEAYKNDENTLERLQAAKFDNKLRLAAYIKEHNGITVNPDAIFDVQVKRLHAYKRQLLNVLHILKLYFDLKDQPELDVVPRVFIFGAKAAPGYHYAKSIIKAINEIANLINSDKEIGDKLKVVFMENYNVSKAEIIIPAANVGEQISLASKEASGTSNMKFMLNGALTIGTLDGANIEIFEAAGKGNYFKFGLNKDEVYDYYKNGNYNARDIYEQNPVVHRILDAFIDGTIPNITAEGPEIFDSLTTYNDEYFVLRDFNDYVRAQKDLEKLYKNRTAWTKASLMNIANVGKFSSDRTIREYADDIWHIHEKK